MAESVEDLERRIDGLRAAVRQAVMAGDRVRAAALRRDLRLAEQAWDEAVAGLAEAAAMLVPARQEPGLVTIREQVHGALTMLSVSAAPKLIVEVHRAFFAGRIASARLTSLRRDEERSFRLAPFSRPYYLCAALSADLLSPARGLLAVSTWPVQQRVIGPLSPRVDFLVGAIKVAERVARLPDAGSPARRLLWRFAAAIPGMAGEFAAVEPEAVVAAARAELEVHQEADAAQRAAAAARVVDQLDEVGQLFGARLGAVAQAATAPAAGPRTLRRSRGRSR